LRRYSPGFCRDIFLGYFLSGWHVDALRRLHCDTNVSGQGPKACPKRPAEINIIPTGILQLRYVLPQSDDIIDVYAINAKLISYSAAGVALKVLSCPHAP